MKTNWEKIGEEIRRTVSDAVENQNYDKLNQAISDTVAQAADAFSDGIKMASDGIRQAADNRKRTAEDRKKETEETRRRLEAQRKASEERRKKAAEQRRAEMMKRQEEEKLRCPAKTVIRIPSRIGSVFCSVLGYTVGGIGVLSMLGGAAVSFWAEVMFGQLGEALLQYIYVLAGTFAATGIGLGIAGHNRLNRINRGRSYVAAIGNKAYCNIANLALDTGRKSKKVVKDLEYMIKKGWFKEGHLDKEKTCLMITDRMYEEYMRLEQQKAIISKEEKDAEEAKKQREQQEYESRKHLPPQVLEIIKQGDAYVEKIRACNDAIPGEEISAKIHNMEILIETIFDRVEQEPRCVSDIQKLMSYYLPTTIKLLEAYQEMDAQPIGGDNIKTAKQEIEDTLDTLNIAFEKLLDGMFMEKAWDVSTDISVLNTMLAKEGLKDDGLTKKEQSTDKKTETDQS